MTSIVHLIAPAATLGGAEQVVLTGARAQADAGDKVLVVALVPPGSHGGAFHRRALMLGLTCVEVACAHPLDLQCRRHLRVLWRTHDVEVIHTHGGRALGVGRLSTTLPMVTTVHGFIATTMRARVMASLERQLARRVDAAVAVSEPLAGGLVDAGCDVDRVFTVHNPLRLSSPPPSPPSPPSSTDIATRRRSGRFVTLARLSAEKGLDVAIRAVAAIPGATLALYGEGPERSGLQRLIDDLGVAERIQLRGATDDVAAVLQDADALLLPSHTEGQPLALLEALAQEVPVLASDVGGVGAVVEGSGAAILLPPGDVDAWVAALQTFADQRQTLAAAASTFAPELRARHAPSTWARSMRSIYDQLPARRRRTQEAA